MLDVLSLVVACVAIAFGVVAAVRARTAGEVAAAAREVAARAEDGASAARADAAAAAEQAREARADAANALDQATRALADAAQSRESAAHAQESAAAAVRALEAARASGVRTADAMSPGGADALHDTAAYGPPVRWTLEHAKGAVWLMKNVGEASANSALLSDATQPPKYIRADEVIPRAVEPGDHLQFRVTAPRGGPPPRVRVTWREDGSDEAKSKDVTLLLEA